MFDGNLLTVEKISPRARLELGTAGSAFVLILGWLGDAMVLGNLPVPGRSTIWITVG